MVKEVIQSPTFIRNIKKTDKSQLEKIKKLIYKIIQDPEVGKPMKYGRRGTREVYAKSFRLSYAYDPQTETLMFLELYHKDEQ